MESKLGAVVISIVATVTFGAVVFLWVLRPPGQTAEVLNVLVGALAAGWAQVLNFWLGSSAGSKAKDGVIQNLSAPPATTEKST